MNDPILNEIHAVRRQHWLEAGGTWEGLCACHDRLSAEMDEKGTETVFRELLAARKRARLAREAEEGLCVGEEAGAGYVAAEGGSTKGQKGEKEEGKDFSDDSLKRTRLVNEVTA